MDLLSDSRCLYLVGYHRDVSRQAVLYDSGICNDRGVSIGDYGTTYALRQPEVFTEGDTSPPVETDWVGIVRGVLFNLRDYHCVSKGACAVYFSDFWVECRIGGVAVIVTSENRCTLGQGYPIPPYRSVRCQFAN